MLWDQYSNPDYLKKLNDIFDRLKTQFREDIKEHLKLQVNYENTIRGEGGYLSL